MANGDRIEEGHAALAAGTWEAARRAFAAAVERDDTAEARFGLAIASWWLGDLGASIAHLERAYAELVRRPEPLLAAGCALRLAFHYRQHLASDAAAAGWLGRAARLVDEHDLAPLRGELLLTRAFLGDDPVEGAAWARDALALAHDRGDRDLELSALGQLGACLVAQGRTQEGVALLDEAMAGCLGGEAKNPDTVVFACCITMTVCTRCADFERAAQWVRAAEQVAARLDFPFFYAECRSLHARILLALGEWPRAEETAAAALAMTDVPGYVADATGVLAELRIAQGRLEDAERLLAPLEAQHRVAHVTARLHLARGAPALAASVCERRLDVLGAAQVESAQLLELFGEAEIALGRAGDAIERGRALAALGDTLGCRSMQARGHRLRGRALGAADPLAARRALDAALTAFVELGMPYEAARTRHALAVVLGDGDRDVAAAEARSALTTFEALGAGGDADDATALLRALGVKAARLGPRGQGELTRRELEVLGLLGAGLSNPEIAARLHVSRKTVEHHVARVLAKLGLRNRAEAAVEAARRENPPRRR